MAYVVPRPNGRWELRRSAATPAGPRSETLLSFGELTDEGVEHAVERSGGELSGEQVRAAARRAGAPVAPDPARRSAAELLRELSRGAGLPRRWHEALLERLGGGGPGGPADTIAEWGGASAERRGAALHELLLLADAIPTRAGRGAPEFPGFDTGAR